MVLLKFSPEVFTSAHQVQILPIHQRYQDVNCAFEELCSGPEKVIRVGRCVDDGVDNPRDLRGVRASGVC